MELIPADGKCIAANDGTIVWCDVVFSEWFAHRGLGAGSMISQLFPGSRDICRPGAVHDDTDKLGKRRYFAIECKPMYGPGGEKVSDEIRLRKVTLQKVLSDIPRLTTQSKSPRELFEKALWLLRDTSHYLAFAGYVARDGRVELVASKGWTEKLKSYISLQPVAPDSPSLAGRTAYHRKQIVMAMKDYSLMPAVKSAIHKLGGDFIVVTPLLDQDKLVGVLTVINDKPLTPDDSEALSAICGQVAVALNVKLQEEAAVAKADDAILFSNLIARTIKDREAIVNATVESRCGHEVAGTLQNDTVNGEIAGMVRSLNDGAPVENVPLKDAVNYAVTNAKDLAEAAHKKLNVKVSGAEHIEVSPLLKHALYEALKNSVQHSPSSVDVDVRASHERSGACRIEVSDNGPGIPDEFKSEVFRPVKENMKNPRGMGLYLIKRIANRYGGRVWIEDRVHGDHRKGTRVVITIPAKP